MGLNTGAAPEITYVPPQEPEYQFQLAAVPRLPPLIPRVVEPPVQIGDVPVTDVAAVDLVFTVRIILIQVVVLHNPSALTKYVVVTVGFVCKKVFPTTKNVPPQEPEYQ